MDYWPQVRLGLHDTWEAFLARVAPPRLFFLSTRGERPLYACRFAAGDALVFGSEGRGLPEPFYGRYRDDLVQIPMPGPGARSLNLANAAAIAAYEAYRQIVYSAVSARSR